MTPNIIVAIDGFSSCGKSTLAKAMAKSLGYAYVDSGAMYRAVTLYFLNHGVDIAKPDAVAEALGHIKIHFERIAGQNHTFLNGQDVENEIREMRVSSFVSPVSTLSIVRKALVKMQQALGQQRGIVMDGRDIGTVVFPDAELKLFMTAEPDIRTKRRLLELSAKGHSELNFEEVKHNLLERDHIDSTREDSPLCMADDAVEIDNSYMSQEEQLSIALEMAKQAIMQKAATPL
jgi:cytidylate kinase